MNSEHLGKLKMLGMVGVMAALIGCIGDLLLLYAPDGGYEKMDYQFFDRISDWRLQLGHYLGVLFIPFELLGFLLVYYALRPAKSKLVLPIIASTVYVMIIGVAYHGMVGLGGMVMHYQAQVQSDPASFTAFFDNFKLFFEPLGFVLFLVFLFISLGLFYIIRYDNTLYPRWVAFFNPLFTYIVIVLIYLLFPGIGSALMVTGFNLSILVLLLVSVMVL